MTDVTARNQAAKRLLAEQSFSEATDATLLALRSELFLATTPEDREAKFQEHSALLRVRSTLQTWAGDEAVRQNEELKP